MSENLELRKAALQSTGWSAKRGDWSESAAMWFYLYGPDGKIVRNTGHHRDELSAFEYAPAVEDNPGISESWFLGWLRKNGFEATIGIYTDDTSDARIYKMQDGHAVQIAQGDGTTTSEARARVVVEAAKKDQV